jgi:hypothetical protein
MALAERRAKSAKMAKDLIARGYFHGRRASKPYPNSGGTTGLDFRLVGSSNYQRYIASRMGNNR